MHYLSFLLFVCSLLGLWNVLTYMGVMEMAHFLIRMSVLLANALSQGKFKVT